MAAILDTVNASTALGLLLVQTSNFWQDIDELNSHRTMHMRRGRHKIETSGSIEEAVELPPEVLALIKPATN